MRAKIPKKAEDRIKSGLRKFKPIIESAKSRDINESDTVILIRDFLASVLGWDMYSEITTEYAIRNTYCDLAVKTSDTVHFLIEAKAVGISLNDTHLRQAVGYAASAGIDWVILTNAWIWQIHRVVFKKPVNTELLIELDLSDINPNSSEAIHPLYLLSKEGVGKAAIDAYHEKAKIYNRFTVAALIQAEPVVKVIIRELRRMNKTLSLSPEDLVSMLKNDVLKRDVIEGEQADAADKMVKKAASQTLRTATKKPQKPNPPALQPTQQPVPQQPSSVPAPRYGVDFRFGQED